VHLSFAFKSLPYYIALTISKISRGGAKINASCYMIKLDFWTWPHCWMLPARLAKATVYKKSTG